MDRMHNILNNVTSFLLNSTAQKTYDGQQRNDLKDSDFLFPETRSFPIVSPADVKDAISNYGRMSGKMSYDAFLRKLYSMCKRKGSEFVAALPEASKEKLGIKDKKSNADICDMMLSPQDDTEDDSSIVENEPPETELMEYKNDFLEMNIGSLRAIMQYAKNILDAIDDPSVKENLTESWLQGKIAITEDYMRTIHDFVKYVPSDDEDSYAADKPGLWENIRKKKEREGKDYKPAKRGDPDRPNPEAWKNLTKDDKKKK